MSEWSYIKKTSIRFSSTRRGQQHRKHLLTLLLKDIQQTPFHHLVFQTIPQILILPHSVSVHTSIGFTMNSIISPPLF